MREKTVSIIIPVYNGSMYIGECLQHIMDQNYQNLQIIVVNDGSVDDTEEIVKGFMAKDARISIITKKNEGPAAARNTGLKFADGEYVIFFDADDIMCQDAVNKMVACASQYHVDLVIGNYYRFDVRKKNMHQINRNQLVTNQVLRKCSRLHPFLNNKLFKMSIIKENKLELYHAWIGEDINFYLKYLLFVKRAYFLRECVMEYRVIKSSLSSNVNSRIMDIIDSFEDVRLFYQLHNEEKLYQSALSRIEIIHCAFQLNKIDRLESQKEQYTFWSRMREYYEKNVYYNIGILGLYMRKRMQHILYHNQYSLKKIKQLLEK